MLRKKKLLKPAVGMVLTVLFLIIINNASDKNDKPWQCSTVVRHYDKGNRNNTDGRLDYTIYGESVSSRKLEYQCDVDDCEDQCRNDRDAMIKRDILNRNGVIVKPNLKLKS